MTRSRRASGFALIILLMTGIFAIPLGCMAQSPAKVTLGPLNPEVLYVYVEPTDPTKTTWGSGMFNTTLEVVMTPGHIHVYLIVSCDKEWSTIVYPKELDIYRSGSYNVSVTVRIPSTVHVNETGNVQLKVMANSPSFNDELESNGTARVQQYYDCELVNIEPHGHDRVQTHRLWARNRGNGPDTIRLEVVDASSHKDVEFELEKAMTRVLEAGESDNISFIIQYKGEENPYHETIGVRAVSMGSEKSGSPKVARESVDFEVREKGPGPSSDIFCFLSVLLIALVVILGLILWKRPRRKRKRKEKRKRKV